MHQANDHCQDARKENLSLNSKGTRNTQRDSAYQWLHKTSRSIHRQDRGSREFESGVSLLPKRRLISLCKG